MKWIKFFLSLLIGIIIAAAGVILLVNVHGTAISLILGLVGLGSGIAILSKGIKIGLTTYDAAENAVHGKPFKVLFIWIFWFIILGGGLFLAGILFLKK